MKHGLGLLLESCLLQVTASGYGNSVKRPIRFSPSRLKHWFWPRQDRKSHFERLRSQTKGDLEQWSADFVRSLSCKNSFVLDGLSWTSWILMETREKAAAHLSRKPSSDTRCWIRMSSVGIGRLLVRKRIKTARRIWYTRQQECNSKREREVQNRQIVLLQWWTTITTPTTTC